MLTIYEEEEKAIAGLVQKLDQDYLNLQMVEDGQREKWMSDPSHVHLDAEIIRLRSECASEFANYRKRHAKAAELAADANAIEIGVRKSILQVSVCILIFEEAIPLGGWGMVGHRIVHCKPCSCFIMHPILSAFPFP